MKKGVHEYYILITALLSEGPTLITLESKSTVAAGAWFFCGSSNFTQRPFSLGPERKKWLDAKSVSEYVYTLTSPRVRLDPGLLLGSGVTKNRGYDNATDREK
jgi:hypothetical protein